MHRSSFSEWAPQVLVERYHEYPARLLSYAGCEVKATLGNLLTFPYMQKVWDELDRLPCRHLPVGEGEYRGLAQRDALALELWESTLCCLKNFEQRIQGPKHFAKQIKSLQEHAQAIMKFLDDEQIARHVRAVCDFADESQIRHGVIEALAVADGKKRLGFHDFQQDLKAIAETGITMVTPVSHLSGRRELSTFMIEGLTHTMHVRFGENRAALVQRIVAAIESLSEDEMYDIIPHQKIGKAAFKPG